MRICCLYNKGFVGILDTNFTLLLNLQLDEEGITRMWKNTSRRSSGIICQCDSNKIIYMTNKFLRNTKLDGIKPYVLYLISLSVSSLKILINCKTLYSSRTHLLRHQKIDCCQKKQNGRKN